MNQRSNKNLITRVKKYEASLKPIKEYIADEYLNTNNEVQIDVNLYAGLEIFNPMSLGKQQDLNDEIYEFIDSKIYVVPLKYPVRICFHNSGLSIAEEQKVKEIIKEHYSLILQDKRIDKRINTLKILGLAVVGFALLSLYFIMQLSSNQQLFMEFLSIAGTFSLWEAVDFYLLESKGLKVQWLNAGQSALSAIAFSKD